MKKFPAHFSVVASSKHKVIIQSTGYTITHVCICASAFLGACSHSDLVFPVPGAFHRKYSHDPLTGLLPGLATAKEAKIPQLISKTGSQGQVGWYSAHSSTPDQRELLCSRSRGDSVDTYTSKALMFIAATFLSRWLIREYNVLVGV